MKILTKAQLEERLRAYYEKHYGENDTDVWYEPPATNVWMFRREGKIIVLQCHILSGEVTAQTKE